MWTANQETIDSEGGISVPHGVEGRSNWDQLQAVLKWSIVDATPSSLSVAEAKGAKPDAPAIVVTFNVKQEFSTRNNTPLTICTTKTLLNGTRGFVSRLRMVSRGEDRTRWLLSNPERDRLRICYPTKDWSMDDLKLQHDFVPIPPSEGLNFHRTVLWKDLFPQGLSNMPPDQTPRIGDRYKLTFVPSRRKHTYLWWNWGDVNHHFEDKKLRIMESSPPIERDMTTLENIAYPYGWDMDSHDGDGNQYKHILTHMDTTPLLIEVTE